MRLFKDMLREIKSLARTGVFRSDQPVRYFTRTGPRAFELVIDTSPSMEFDDYPPSRLAAAQAAADRFVQQCATHDPTAVVGIVFYNSDATVAAPLLPVGDSRRSLERAIRSPEVSAMTNISAGLDEARLELENLGKDFSPTVILLTDGDANAGNDPVETAAMLKNAGIQLDIIGIGGSPNEVNEHDLKQMASIVNGQRRYWFIRDTPELVRKFEALALGKV